MRKLICTILLLLLTSPCFAQEREITDDKVKLVNLAMLDIFQDILKEKEYYKDLANFDDSALTKNQYGMYMIKYKHVTEDATSYEKFEIALSVVDLEDYNIFQDEQNAFELGFPLLGLKFIGMQRKSKATEDFNILAIIQDHGLKLWDAQQNYMPYKLTIEPVKYNFKTDEDIDFIVSLKNTSVTNIKVKDINNKTLYCSYNDKPWGAQLTKGISLSGKDVILEPNEVMSKGFRGDSFQFAREFNIFCSYAMTYQGVEPSAKLNINVVE